MVAAYYYLTRFVAVAPQVDEAIDQANKIGAMTVAGVLALVLIAACTYFVMAMRKKDGVITDLAKQLQAVGREARDDLKNQAANQREDVKRLEGALQKGAAADAATMQAVQEVRTRIDALERGVAMLTTAIAELPQKVAQALRG